MIDLGEMELNEEDIEEMTKDVSIASGFELGAINTVMPDTMKYSTRGCSVFAFLEWLAALMFGPICPLSLSGSIRNEGSPWWFRW